MVVSYNPNYNSENYYENLSGERKELIKEMYYWMLYDRTSKKKETKPFLRIVE